MANKFLQNGRASDVGSSVPLPTSTVHATEPLRRVARGLCRWWVWMWSRVRCQRHRFKTHTPHHGPGSAECSTEETWFPRTFPQKHKQVQSIKTGKELLWWTRNLPQVQKPQLSQVKLRNWETWEQIQPLSFRRSLTAPRLSFLSHYRTGART